jgi:hypothetical protein
MGLCGGNALHLYSGLLYSNTSLDYLETDFPWFPSDRSQISG